MGGVTRGPGPRRSARRRCSLAAAQHLGCCTRRRLPGAPLPVAADPSHVGERGGAVLRGQGTWGRAGRHNGIGLWVVTLPLRASAPSAFSFALVFDGPSSLEGAS